MNTLNVPIKNAKTSINATTESHEPSVISVLPTSFGEFTVYGYAHAHKEHVALVMGEVSNADDVLCRVHSECLTGEVFHSLRCDCKEQLERALARIAEAGRGVLVYLRQEGRGIGLIEKLHAYNLQRKGMDTVDANIHLGHPVDAREYALAASMLMYLQVRSVQLMTNNPDKVAQLEKHGVRVSQHLALKPQNITSHNSKYLKTKAEKLGHTL